MNSNVHISYYSETDILGYHKKFQVSLNCPTVSSMDMKKVPFLYRQRDNSNWGEENVLEREALVSHFSMRRFNIIC